MKSACCKGLDVITGRVSDGPYYVGLDSNKTYLVLHVNDPKGLVAHEKGAGLAALATTLVPQYVEETIYQTIADELKTQFADKGSSVSVDIMQTKPKAGDKPPPSNLKGGILLGVVLSAVGYGVVKLAGRLIHGPRRG